MFLDLLHEEVALVAEKALILLQLPGGFPAYAVGEVARVVVPEVNLLAHGLVEAQVRLLLLAVITGAEEVACREVLGGQAPLRPYLLLAFVHGKVRSSHCVDLGSVGYMGYERGTRRVLSTR